MDAGPDHDAASSEVDAGGRSVPSDPDGGTPAPSTGVADAGSLCPELSNPDADPAAAVAATLGIDEQELVATLESTHFEAMKLLPAMREACAKGDPRGPLRAEVRSLFETRGLVFTCQSELEHEYETSIEAAAALGVEVEVLSAAADEQGISEDAVLVRIAERVDTFGGEGDLRESVLSRLIESLVSRSDALTLDLGDFASLHRAQVTHVHYWTETRKLFDIEVEQPYDHAHPDGPSFTQHVQLTVVDPEGATLLGTGGYGDADYGNTAELLTANLVGMPHRFYEEAPADAELWQYLTPEQAAADTHRVVELLKPVLSGPWVSTGLSKGGSSALLHRRHYPDDVVGTVAWVAPLGFQGAPNKGLERLEQIDEDGCAERVRELQRLMLENLATLREQPGDIFCLKETAKERLLNAAESFEWGFWTVRWELECEDVNSMDADLDMLRAQLERTMLASAGNGTGSHSAWAYEQLATWGEPKLHRDEMKPLIASAKAQLGLDNEGAEDTEPPWGPTPELDERAMAEARDWVATEGRDLVLIYGEYDPWSAWSLEVNDRPSVLSITAPRGLHWTTHRDVAGMDLVRFRSLLEDWVGVEAVNASAFE